jgi:hypothetical protein
VQLLPIQSFRQHMLASGTDHEIVIVAGPARGNQRGPKGTSDTGLWSHLDIRSSPVVLTTCIAQVTKL